MEFASSIFCSSKFLRRRLLAGRESFLSVLRVSLVQGLPLRPASGVEGCSSMLERLIQVVIVRIFDTYGV
jgi:hypothetical protein